MTPPKFINTNHEATGGLYQNFLTLRPLITRTVIVCTPSVSLYLAKSHESKFCANEIPRNRLFCPVFSLTTTSAAEQSNWTIPGECWPLKTRFLLAGLHSGMIFSAIYRAWAPRAADTALNVAARTPNGGLKTSSNLNPWCQNSLIVCTQR